MRFMITILAAVLFSSVATAGLKPKGALEPTYCGENTLTEPAAPAAVCLHKVSGEDKAVLSLASGRQVSFFRVIDYDQKEENVKFWSLGEVKVQFTNGYLYLNENDYMETIEIFVTKANPGYVLTSEELQLNVKLTPVSVAK